MEHANFPFWLCLLAMPPFQIHSYLSWDQDGNNPPITAIENHGASTRSLCVQKLDWK